MVGDLHFDTCFDTDEINEGIKLCIWLCEREETERKPGFVIIVIDPEFKLPLFLELKPRVSLISGFSLNPLSGIHPSTAITLDVNKVKKLNMYEPGFGGLVRLG